MTSQRDKLEKKLTFLTLSSAAKSIEGLYTTVDLRNESCLTGKIALVDGFMNIEMEDVIFYDQRGNMNVFETFFIKKRMIRYIHIPKEIDICQRTMEFFQNWNKPVRRANNGKRTFKITRAQKYQQEIIKEAFSQ